MWEIRLKISNLVYSKMLHLKASCEIQKATSEGVLCVFGKHTFVPISWMCKKQTAVSRSSAESGNTSIHARLRMGGIQALHHARLNMGGVPTLQCGRMCLRQNIQYINSGKHTCLLVSLDHVPPNISNSTHSTQLCLFDDNVAVIKMINKGRSPNLRYVTRKYRIDLDRLLERVNLDHSI